MILLFLSSLKLLLDQSSRKCHLNLKSWSQKYSNNAQLLSWGMFYGIPLEPFAPSKFLLQYLDSVVQSCKRNSANVNERKWEDATTKRKIVKAKLRRCEDDRMILVLPICPSQPVAFAKCTSSHFRFRTFSFFAHRNVGAHLYSSHLPVCLPN